MTPDPVVEEVRAGGRSLTARYGNDVEQPCFVVLEERARAEPRESSIPVEVIAGERSRTVECEPRP